MESSRLVEFTKLVSDSPSSEGVSALLAQTVVEKCGVSYALVFGMDDEGDFRVVSSYGSCDAELSALDLKGVDSLAELRTVVMKACKDRGLRFRVFPLISDAGLFGALVAVYVESAPPSTEDWMSIETLTELTAISLNKAYQHQKLQKAFDDLHASQELLLRTEKFRALGQMSAGIAHDLKNVLNPLFLYADEMRDVAGNREEVLEILARIDRILTRGLETVERLRDFSRLSPEEGDTAATDLNAMVQEAVEISKAKLGEARLVLQLGSPSPVVVRPADCITAIVNLVFNAVDAVEGKGTITIRTDSSDGGSWVEVADDGPGIPPEVRNRILEPLFTTKGNHGTGLGVSTVYAFTQRHGGRLEIESEAGHGARFRMWFPAAGARSE